jgi:hypothetical protein
MDGGQGLPSAVEQLRPPTRQEQRLVVGRLRGSWLRHVRVERSRPVLAGTVVVGDQVAEGRLEVVAEAAALGIGPAEVAPQEAHRELLS